MKFISLTLLIVLSTSCNDKDFVGSQGINNNKPNTSDLSDSNNKQEDSIGEEILATPTEEITTKTNPAPIKTFQEADLSLITELKIVTGSQNVEVGKNIDIEIYGEIDGELIEIDPKEVNLKFNGQTSADFDSNTGKFVLKDSSGGSIKITAELNGKNIEKDITISECISGTVLGIWLDELSTGELTDENFLGEILTFQGSESAKINYNYFSASAHPKIGPGTEGFVNKVFFYRDSSGLNLNFISGADGAGNGGNKVNIEINTSGNSNNDGVVFSDEGGELKEKSNDTSGNYYEGNFNFHKNTDGGIIGPFAGEDFRISVDIIRTDNVKDAKFVSSDGSSFTLKGDSGGISSFVIAFKEEKSCK